jgi:AAA15 family ATPase/GTPase
MLCQFTFWNYKSYRDEVTLNLCPANISDHNEHLLVEPETGEEFLPIAILYGPNGGGKSTVLDSFRYFRRKVLSVQSFPFPEGTVPDDEGVAVISKVPKRARQDRQISFLFDKKYIDLPTGWSVNFISSGYEYKYSLAIVRNQVIDESLYVKHLNSGEVEKLIERGKSVETPIEQGKSTVLGDALNDVNANNVSVELPLLCFIAALYDYDHIKNVIKWFRDAFVIDFGTVTGEQFFNIPEKDEDKPDFFKILDSMGIRMDDLRVVEDSKGRIQDIFSIYRHNDDYYDLDFQQESSGTRKVFSFLSRIMKSIREGLPVFIDELDAKLHPKLLEVVISLFTRREINKYGAQLILTSHDLYTMSNKFLRRDEIWFAAKRDDFSSHLYSLSDFKKISNTSNRARKDENFAKQYLEGRYGADPYFQRIESWTVET